MIKFIFIPSMFLIIFFMIKLLSVKREYFNNLAINHNLFNEVHVRQPLGSIICNNNTAKSRGAVCTSNYVPMTDEELAKIGSQIKQT